MKGRRASTSGMPRSMTAGGSQAVELWSRNSPAVACRQRRRRVVSAAWRRKGMASTSWQVVPDEADRHAAAGRSAQVQRDLRRRTCVGGAAPRGAVGGSCFCTLVRPRKAWSIRIFRRPYGELNCQAVIRATPTRAWHRRSSMTERHRRLSRGPRYNHTPSVKTHPHDHPMR